MLQPDQIVAGLKKIGPCSPGQLADHLEVESAALGYHLKKLLDAGTVKAAGAANARRIALPEQQFADAAETPAPPQRRKTKKHRKAKYAKKPRPPRTTRPAAKPAKRAAAPAERFIPAVDAGSRLIIVNGAEPLIFSDVQTAAIASLLFQHYDKA